MKRGSSEARILRLIEQGIESSPTIASMRSDIADHTTAIVILKTDVSALKTDVAELKTDVRQLKTDVAELKNTSHRHGVMLEAIQSDIKTVLEVCLSSTTAHRRLDTHDRDIAGLRRDVLLTQDALRDHAANASKHR